MFERDRGPTRSLLDVLERVFGNGVVLTREGSRAGAIDLRRGRVVVVIRDTDVDPDVRPDVSGDGPGRRPPGYRVGG